MGYYGLPKWDGEKTIDAIIRREFSSGHTEVLDTASRGNIHYLAVRLKPIDESGEVHPLDNAVIAFVVIARNNGDYLDLKVLDETCGPYYHDAPKRLLKKLTPTDCERSNRWRNTCLEKFKNV